MKIFNKFVTCYSVVVIRFYFLYFFVCQNKFQQTTDLFCWLSLLLATACRFGDVSILLHILLSHQRLNRPPNLPSIPLISQIHQKSEAFSLYLFYLRREHTFHQLNLNGNGGLSSWQVDEIKYEKINYKTKEHR